MWYTVVYIVNQFEPCMMIVYMYMDESMYNVFTCKNPHFALWYSTKNVNSCDKIVTMPT